MAPRILPEYGFDPSCGNFEVKIKFAENGFDSSDSASIQVQYSQSIDSESSFYSASLPWSGGEISVADAETLLNAAEVPAFIQFVSAIGMILKFIDQTLGERRAAETSTGLPSILVKIWSDQETIEWDCDMSFEDEEEEY